MLPDTFLADYATLAITPFSLFSFRPPLFFSMIFLFDISPPRCCHTPLLMPLLFRAASAPCRLPLRVASVADAELIYTPEELHGVSRAMPWLIFDAAC